MLDTKARDVDEGLAFADKIVELGPNGWYFMSPREVEDFQLQALAKRFDDLAGRLPILGKLAAGQGINQIERIEDGALLLFAHSVYKSYPLSVLDNGDFDRLTRWLRNVTVHDVSNVDSSACETIDDWVDALEAQTPLRIVHSSGTTGKLSFMPKSETELRRSALAWPKVYEGFGREVNSPLNGIENIPLISPAYRRGGMGQSRNLQAITRYVYGGDESKVVVLNPGRLSADMLSLGGRLRAAEAMGEAGKLRISEKLLARREAFIQEQEEAPARRAAFFRDVAERFRGQRVVLMGLFGQHYDVAQEALKRGIRNVFAPDSLLTVFGGLKGRALPEGYENVIMEYLGVPFIRRGYGMSETVTTFPSCPEGNYHIQPFVIPYVLDPKTGKQLPRTGTVTGRFGLIDLLAETYWGGLLSGDKVTLSWADVPCACGRQSPYIHPLVTRFSEVEGGDDKVTCAGAPEAHDSAIAFLSEIG
jgi:hypothetical protein